MNTFKNSAAFFKAASLVAILSLAACSGDDNDDEVRALENRASDLEARLMLAEANDASMSTSLSDIEMRLADIESALDLQGELADLSDLLDELEERLDTLENVAACGGSASLRGVSCLVDRFACFCCA